MASPASGIVLIRQGAAAAQALAFALTLFTSALLIFLVQPIAGRLLTPLLGGAPAVWNTVMVFFQAALLAGYAYAYALARVRSLRLQVAIHAVVLCLGGLFLPLGLSSLVGTPPSDSMAVSLWLLGALAISVGAPFAALSATAPLLQAWYARSRAADSGDPYHLYAWSNAGSLLALIGYPLLMEPALSLSDQRSFWSFGFAVAGLSIVACGWIAARQAGPAPAALEPVRIAPMRRVRWIATAAAPSALLLAIGQHIATDVASAPLLWTAPLALYLGTFILAFGKQGAAVRKFSARWAGTSIACLILSLLTPTVLILSIGASLAAVFFGALTAHSALAEDRPAAGGLTDFYMSMSLGGVIGGAATALVAPLVFDGVYELALAAGACLLFGIPARGPRRLAFVTAAIALSLSLLALMFEVDLRIPIGATFALAVLQCRATPRLAATLATVGLLLIQFAGDRGATIARERSFFGVLKTERYADPGGAAKVLMHGTTIHGAQRLDPADAATPLTYYASVTPLGEAIHRATAQAPAIDIGVIGLGTGALMCQMRPADRVRVFEIDPVMARWASGEHFDYLRRCTPDARIILGDGRLQLARDRGGPYDILVIDAFSSDSIPTHLMTKEAVQLYFERLKPDGVLLLHVSNRHLDLAPEAAAIARDLGLVARTRKAGEGRTLAAFKTTAVALARTEDVFTRQGYGAGWTVPVPAGGRAWSDDYVNLLRPMFRPH